MTYSVAPDGTAELDKPGQVAKFIVPAVLAVLTILTPIFTPTGVDLSIFTVLTVAVALANAPVVFYVGGTRAKTIAQAVVAFIQVVIAGLSSASQWTDLGAVSYETWVGAALAAAGIYGVAKIPNAPLAEKVVPVSQRDADVADPKVHD